MPETLDSASSSFAPRPPLLTRLLLLRFVSILGASTSFYLLLSVVPHYASTGGAGAGAGGAAGLATGALMLATVVGEFVTPRLVDRFGYRLVLGAGLVLLGAPALVLTLSRDLWWIVAVCLLRGLGFAFTVVAGGALTASLIPAERRGEGLALVGIVSGVPSLAALPLGVWLAAHTGYGVVCTMGAVAALAAIVSVPGLPDRVRVSGRAIGITEGLRTAQLTCPAVVFAAVAMAAGIVVTFLPLAVPASATGLVTVALFVQPATATLARWLAGRHGDRRGPAGLVLPGLLLSASGTLLMALTSSPVAVVIAVGVFGFGFGVTQNATLTLMYARVPAAGYDTVSALWNLAYDAGMGVGAIAFGWFSAGTGYRWAFALTGAAMLTALAPAWRDRRTVRPALETPVTETP
ncbi:MFS transporter [Streptomyces alanosinicus]|uniref:MFS transporter n=1 Tax=Streptomyces alanosinicus TaxID=68171 RepID=A0A918YSX8_9ACTN|nr:MFS transporter [Streptomyces alanosinicus]GHE14386.1 MFS transporter [Streptomyces alanosinicus]